MSGDCARATPVPTGIISTKSKALMTRPTPRARAGPDGARAREQLSTATDWELDMNLELKLYSHLAAARLDRLCRKEARLDSQSGSP